MVQFKPVKIVKRGSSYQLYYYTPRGERRRVSVGKDYRHAQKLARKFDDWLLDDKEPEDELARMEQQKVAGEITLKSLFSLFMDRHAKYLSKNTQELWQYLFENIKRCKELADIPISRISKRLVFDYMHARLDQDGVTNATVNREAALIKNMLFRATEWEYIDTNPLQGLKLLPEPKKRDVSLTIQDAAKVLDFLHESMANIVEFAFYTGFRKENILSLRIEQLRFHDLTPTAEVELILKCDKRELFPLGAHATTVVKRTIGKRTEGYVFLNPKTQTRYMSIHKTFDRAVRKAGLTVHGTKFRFHDIRHVFASTLIRKGARLDDIRMMLGHEDSSTTDRYTSIDRFDVKEVLSYIPAIEQRGHEKCLDQSQAEAS